MYELYFSAIDWHDSFRLVIIVCGLLSLGGLIHKYIVKSKTWNEKTKDYWFSFVMWSAAAISFGFEGIARDRPLGPTVIFMFFATIVTLKGLLKKGHWGGN
jgi:hypothetical protein